MYKDLRDFVEAVEQLGALRRVDGADPQFEIGAITEVAAGRPGGSALLFDDIKGFPRGFRILTNAVTSAPRAALALGLDPGMRPLDALKAWMEKRKSLKPHAPVTVKHAPFCRTARPRSISETSRARLAPRRRRAVPRLGFHRHHARSGRRLDQRLDLPRPGARAAARHRAVRPCGSAWRDHCEKVLGPRSALPARGRLW